MLQEAARTYKTPPMALLNISGPRRRSRQLPLRSTTTTSSSKKRTRLKTPSKTKHRRRAASPPNKPVMTSYSRTSIA